MEKPPRHSAGLPGGGGGNQIAAQILRARVLQVIADAKGPITNTAIALRLTRQGNPISDSKVGRIRRAGTTTIVGSGGAHRIAAPDALKAMFIATVVGEVDADGFRFGGTGVKRAVSLWNEDHECKVEIKLTSARRWLRDAGFTSRVPQVGPFLKKNNIEQRQRFFELHWRHSPTWWTLICFTDSTAVASEHTPNPRNERRFCLAGERPRPLKKKNVPAHKIHVYGACTKWGMVGPIYPTDSINSHRYITQILPKLISGITALYERHNDRCRWTLQQDGATPHTAERTQAWLAAQPGLRWWSKKSWPGSSPDLSPVEGMWDLLQLHVTPPGCMGISKEVQKARIDAWFAIDHTATCRKALRGMPRRLHELEAAKFQAFRHE